MDEITDGCKLPTEGATTQLTDIQRAGLTLENRTTASSKKRLSLCEGKEKNNLKRMESCLSCVAMLVAGLWGHVVLCSYVP